LRQCGLAINLFTQSDLSCSKRLISYSGAVMVVVVV
jgi:hypothetical protein